jgi:hypothetical protein
MIKPVWVNNRRKMNFVLEMNATLVERTTVDARDKRNHLASNKAII